MGNKKKYHQIRVNGYMYFVFKTQHTVNVYDIGILKTQ